MMSSAILLFVLGVVAADPHTWGMPHGHHPHGQSYPHGQNFPHGHAYGHNQGYPQGQNYPQGQDYPQVQNYPQGQDYPQVQNYPQAQDYPQGQEYPQGHYYPQSDVNLQKPQAFDPNAEKPRVKFVQGSIDDLRTMDTQWICTNQKSGDTMIIGSMDGTGNILGPKPQPPLQPNPNLQRPQQPSPRPQDPQQSSPWTQEPQQPNPKPQPTPWSQRPQQPQQPQQPPQPQQPQPPQPPQQPQPRPLPVPQNPQQSVTTSEPSKPAESMRNQQFVEVPPPGFIPSKQDPLKSPYTTTRDPLDEFDWAAYIKTANCSVPTLIPPSVTTPVPTPTTEFDGAGIIEPRVNDGDA